tara:strand:- start:116 stop:439 length:324 start_codon:yes stop_codon:yes gene_type:complete
MYKIRGQIKNLEDQEINTAEGKNYIKKLITVEETDTGFKNLIQFEVFGKENIDTMEHLQKLSTEQLVNINFYIKSREYKGKFYNTLIMKEVQIEQVDSMPFNTKAPF